MSISKSDVREGDVLLLMESGIGPALIALLDDGIYSHSAYFNGTDVVGCVRVGLVSQSLDEVLADTDWMYIDIYRFVDGKGGEMGSPDLPAAPVSAVCNAYVKEGVSYATNDLYFYWVLILLHNLPETAEGRKKVWFLINAVILLLEEADPKLHTGMICSEFVANVFLKAEPFAKYTLQIADSYQIPGPPDKEFEPVYEVIREALEKIAPDVLRKIDAVREGGISAVVPALVTPDNLRKSPSLTFVGRLKGDGAPPA